MAEFEMKCPHCGDELTVQSEWNGMEVECPSCKKTFKVMPTPKSNREIKKYLAKSDRENKKNLDQVNGLRNLVGILVFLAIVAVVLPSPLDTICWIVFIILFLIYIAGCCFS